MGKSNITQDSHSQSSSQISLICYVCREQWLIDSGDCSLFWCLLIFCRGCRLGCTWLQTWYAHEQPSPLQVLLLLALPFHRVSFIFLCHSWASIPLYDYFISHFKIVYYFSYLPDFFALFAYFFSIIIFTLLCIFAERKKSAQGACKILSVLNKSPVYPWHPDLWTWGSSSF